MPSRALSSSATRSISFYHPRSLFRCPIDKFPIPNRQTRCIHQLLPPSPSPPSPQPYRRLHHPSLTSTRRLTTAPPSTPSPTPTPTPLTPSTYHTLSDTYIETLLHHLETLSETSPDIDVEYSAGVLTLIHGGKSGLGTYVLNKQPPNKQIWLSSPVSGPKRYDWVQGEEGQGAEGGVGGKWVYLRDGTTLNELLEREIGVVMRERGV